MAKVFSYSQGMRSSGTHGLFERMIDDLDLTIEDTKLKHGIGSVSDYTLCGIAYGEYVEVSEFKNGKITCSNCIAQIEYAKSFKKGKDY